MQQLPIYQTIEDVRQAALSCVACNRAQSRRQVVFGAGNPRARLMLIGESPSSTDDLTGQPFTGPAGDLLDELLFEAGTQRNDVWITNLVRCHAGRMRDGRAENRPVRASEVAACRVWLELEIQYVNPRLIVAIGAPATRELAGVEERLLTIHGQTFERPDGRLVMPVIQPAYVMRLRNLQDVDAFIDAREQLISDLQRAVTIANQ